MKKIVYVVPQLRYGGGEKQFLLLLKHLDKSKYYPIVVCLEANGELAQPIRDMGIEVVFFPGNKIQQVFLIYKLLSQLRPQIVHTWLNNEWGRLAAILYNFRRKRVKIVASERDEMHASTRRFRVFFLFLSRILSYFSDAITFNSPKAMAAFTKSWFNEDACRFIGNGLENSELIATVLDRKDTDKLRLVMVARLVIQKNHDFLLKSLACFERRECLEVLLVGDGPLAGDIQVKINNLGLDAVVTMLGKQTNIPSLLRKSDVGLLLSTSEGFSNSVLEYLANGLAVILSDAGANSMCVDSNGFVVSTIDELHLALNAFIDNRNFLMENKKKSVVVAQRFLIENVVRQYEALYA